MNSVTQRYGSALREAAQALSKTDSAVINAALCAMANAIRAASDDILTANQHDLKAAQGQSDAFLDRLRLTPERIDAIAAGVEAIAALPDPVGSVLEEWEQPNGLQFQKVSVPIGVLGIIYESRPNVTVDAAALCLKSHNAVLLRGGSDSLHSALALHACIAQALKDNDLPEAAVSIIDDPDRALVGDILKSHEIIDVIVPRGGRGLIERVMNEATMPVFAHLDGNCHIYVDRDVDADMAADVIVNAKLRRTGICGALESLLFHADLDKAVQIRIVQALLDKGCKVRGDDAVQKLDSRVEAATDEDWASEYLDAIVSCKVVVDVSDAVAHINRYGSHHTDSVLTNDDAVAARFLKEVDSAIVLHNASTQFADGGEFGMGAEIGIGTGKLHARGPVGVKQLTTFKYLVHGQGHTRP